MLTSDARLQCLSGASLQLACVKVGDETGIVTSLHLGAYIAFVEEAFCFDDKPNVTKSRTELSETTPPMDSLILCKTREVMLRLAAQQARLCEPGATLVLRSARAEMPQGGSGKFSPPRLPKKLRRARRGGFAAPKVLRRNAAEAWLKILKPLRSAGQLRLELGRWSRVSQLAEAALFTPNLRNDMSAVDSWILLALS